MLSKKHIKLALASGFLLAVAGFLYFQKEPCPGPQKIVIDDVSLRAMYACTPQEQSKGLGYMSAEDFAAKADVMVFPFEQKAHRTFWMQGMEFPIDIVWVQGNKVVKIEENAQPPQGDEDPQRMLSYPFEVDRVLELQAGAVNRLQIGVGSRVYWY